VVQEVGLEVSDVVVLIDREQGGREHLKGNGLTLHAAFSLSFIVDTLLSKGLLTAAVVESVKRFIAENQTTAAVAGVARRHCALRPLAGSNILAPKGSQ
jgi:uridine monophosphate synthetase